MLQRSRLLGQDDDYSWTPWEFEAARTPTMPEIPGGEQIWTTGGTSRPWESIATPQASGSDWWGSVKDVLVPVSGAAANIIRAITGQPGVKPGESLVYDPRSGKYTTVSPSGTGLQNFLIPALLLGGGAILLFRRKR